MNVEQKCKILMVGCGWHSRFYLRAVDNLKEHLEFCGILMRTAKQ